MNTFDNKPCSSLLVNTLYTKLTCLSCEYFLYKAHLSLPVNTFYITIKDPLSPISYSPFSSRPAALSFSSVCCLCVAVTVLAVTQESCHCPCCNTGELSLCLAVFVLQCFMTPPFPSPPPGLVSGLNEDCSGTSYPSEYVTSHNSFSTDISL